MNTEIHFVDVSENFHRICISGRFDILGSEAIALRFTSLAVATQLRLVVDLTAVSFLASIGIRSIVINAKALLQRGGKMVLYVEGNDAVAKTLKVAGIETLIPMLAGAAEADIAALA